MMSPDSAFWNANTTSSTASSRLITNRVIDGSVIVIGFPAFICSIQSGTTEPREQSTLPYLVQQMLVLSGDTVLDFATITFSIIALLVPIAFTGYAALSVDKQIIFFTPASIAAVKTFSVPRTLVFTASIGKNSQDGTCFRAAA